MRVALTIIESAQTSLIIRGHISTLSGVVVLAPLLLHLEVVSPSKRLFVTSTRLLGVPKRSVDGTLAAASDELAATFYSRWLCHIIIVALISTHSIFLRWD